ncbi:MAG: hypothetical protein DRI75_03145 [Bacteroidetes bacterium]|nr:MAG: hypothetical protein DRI75_03145 [Bacteroidota bacterium]
MVLDNIEKLLEKYDNGETTLQEEQQLKNYFAQETVEPHLEVYKPMFQYFLKTQEEQFTKDIPLKPSKTYTLYKWISVAAVAVLMFGIYTQVNNPVQPTNEQLLAYNQTMDALNLVSSQFKKGNENMNALGLMSSSFNKGVEDIAYINQFSNTTNKIFKNE